MVKKYSISLANTLGVAVALSLLSGVTPASAQMVGSSPSTILEKVNQLNGTEPLNTVNQNGEPEVAQVTAVSELSDVQPTDWAFTALQSLVERYGCIEGYPDRTYRGKHPLSRYEFAAGLNACLDKINEIISAGLADKVSKDDLAALQRLQEEFASELAALKGRVDSLEGKVAVLERQQFSTTTKLTGEVVFNVTGGGSSNGFGPSLIAGNGQTGVPFTETSANVTANARVRLDFNTSFTGKDLLITRLEVGNGGGASGDVLGVAPAGNIGNLGFNTFGQDFAGVGSNVAIGKLRYDFRLFSDLKVSLGTNLHVYDHIDINSFANIEARDFSSTFFINNPLVVLINPDRGAAGAVLDWNIAGGDFSIRALYLAANAADANSGANLAGVNTNRGVTGDPYQGTFEVEYAPKDKNGNLSNFAIRLQYTNASISNADITTGGVNVEWAISKKVAIFGRYGFGTIDTRNQLVSNSQFLGNFVNRDATGNGVDPQTWMAGIAFPELFRSGDMLGIAVGQPFISSQVGNATQTNIEAFYRFPITDNISITPDVQVIINANNNTENNTITIGSLRTTFTF